MFVRMYISYGFAILKLVLYCKIRIVYGQKYYNQHDYGLLINSAAKLANAHSCFKECELLIAFIIIFVYY